MRRRRGEEPEDQGIAELAALADGTLAEGRRAALEARIAESPGPAEQPAGRRRGRALGRGGGGGGGAPGALRAGIGARGRPPRPPPARRLGIVAPATAV